MIPYQNNVDAKRKWNHLFVWERYIVGSIIGGNLKLYKHNFTKIMQWNTSSWLLESNFLEAFEYVDEDSIYDFYDLNRSTQQEVIL